MKKGEVIETIHGPSVIERIDNDGVWIRFVSDEMMDEWTGEIIHTNTATHRCFWLRKHKMYQYTKGISNRIKYCWYWCQASWNEFEDNPQLIFFTVVMSLIIFFITFLLLTVLVYDR